MARAENVGGSGTCGEEREGWRGAGGVVRDSRNALMIDGEVMVIGNDERIVLEVSLFSVNLGISLLVVQKVCLHTSLNPTCSSLQHP